MKDTDGIRSRYTDEFNYLLLSHKYGDITQLELVKNIQLKLEAYGELNACAQSAEQG